MPAPADGEDWPNPRREWARMNGVTLGGAGAGKTSEAPPSLARLQPGQRVGRDVYGFAVAICPPSRPGADIRQRMGGRVRNTDTKRIPRRIHG